MLTERENLLIEARTWLGTPWMHNQCVKGVGVDCVNFVWAVAKESGLNGSDLPTRYARVSRYREIEKYLDDCFPSTPIDELVRGNILLFQLNGYGSHVAYATENGIIHASVTWKKVVEHPIDGIWERTLIKQWSVF